MIGRSYYLYQATGKILLSVIVGIVGVALLLATKVKRNGRIIGGILVGLSVFTIYSTYHISKDINLSERRGRINLVGDALNRLIN
jgi:hypothetical protein